MRTPPTTSSRAQSVGQIRIVKKTYEKIQTDKTKGILAVDFLSLSNKQTT